MPPVHEAGMPAAFEHCAQVVRQADRDRFIATLFAPAERRGALHALHAFALEIAAVRDHVSTPLPGEIRLQWWRDALTGAAEGEFGGHPVLAALRQTVASHALPVSPLLELIEARRFDLYDEPMPSLQQLEDYAAATAATPIRLSVQVLAGVPSAEVDAVVRHAGIAQAIVGILQAFPSHASRRQSYLPLELLRRHGTDPEDAFAGRSSPQLSAAAADLRQLARRHYQAAKELVQRVPERTVPALLPLALVPAWLDRMDRRDDPLQPPDIPGWRRQWLLWRATRTLFQS